MNVLSKEYYALIYHTLSPTQIWFQVEMEMTWEEHSSNMIKRDKDAQYAQPNPNFVSQCRKVEMEMRWEGHS